MSQANKPMTDQEIEMMKTRYNDAFQQERIAELETTTIDAAKTLGL